ncbi:Colicin V production protein [Rubripirellula lacrimiformis]|uniref:Colicin V production protein n=1 Tax=Rubripirellula lacrimiformis TaxID=1930273 RepID=A0A517N690_9BACT|nr:CvpA family protein [Rubripirellula lacrimiformis]QDT02528.1 Colicin V production protein [Rubripirellula lacrimiformis]
MEIYDIVMLVVLFGAMLFGAVKGLAWQLASIASILGSYVVALKLREPFSQSISVEPPWNRFLAMLILYVGTALLIWVAFRMVSGSIDRMKLREFDNHIGAIFGLIKGALYCTLITMFAVTLAGDGIREAVVRSKSGNYIAKVLDRSQTVIPPEIHEVISPYLERFDREFSEGKTEGGLLDQATGWLAGGDSPPAAQPWSPTNFVPPPGTAQGAIEPIDRQVADPSNWVPQQAQQAIQNRLTR